MPPQPRKASGLQHPSRELHEVTDGPGAAGAPLLGAAVPGGDGGGPGGRREPTAGRACEAAAVAAAAPPGTPRFCPVLNAFPLLTGSEQSP